MEILQGLGWCFLTITVIKLLDFITKRNDPRKFSFKYFGIDNWMDYFIQLSVSLIIFVFDHDALNFINSILKRFEFDSEIPHFENGMFYFIAVPVIVSFVLNKIFKVRKKVSIPVQEKVIKSKINQ